MQVLVALGLLFLPVFATCYVNEPDCRRASYIQMGGSFIGYLLLVGMILLGTAVVITHLGLFPNLSGRQNRRILWLAVAGSFITLIVGAWSIGLAFLPGGLLLLLATFANRKTNQIYKS